MSKVVRESYEVRGASNRRRRSTSRPRLPNKEKFQGRYSSGEKAAHCAQRSAQCCEAVDVCGAGSFTYSTVVRSYSRCIVYAYSCM